MQTLYSRLSCADALAAKVLAAALCSRCPKVQIIEAKDESYGFSCTFYLSDVFSEELFPFLEERMYALLQPGEIQTFEMLSSNALEFLKFHHQRKRAQRLKGRSGLVDAIKIGSYADFFEEAFSYEEALTHLKVFKLLSLTHTVEQGFHGESRHCFRIKGVSASGPQHLKALVKTVKAASRSYHMKARHLFLWTHSQDEKTLLWLPPGLALKNKLLSFFKNFLRERNFQEIESSSIPSAALFSLPELQALSSIFCVYQDTTQVSQEPDLGLYSLENTLSIRAVRYFEGQDKEACLKEMLELLNALIKTLHIDGKCSRIDQGQNIRFFIKDSFEREWEVASIAMEEKKNLCQGMFSLLSVERWLALLLDLFGGELESGPLAKIFRE